MTHSATRISRNEPTHEIKEVESELKKSSQWTRLTQLILGFLNGLCGESRMTISSKVVKANMFEVYCRISPGHMDHGPCPLDVTFEFKRAM